MGHFQPSRLIVMLLAAAAVVAEVRGQQPVPDGAAAAAAGRTNPVPVPVVRIDAIVTDKTGRPITDLKPADFEIVENGVPVTLGGVELRTPLAGPAAPAADDDEDAARLAGNRVFAFFLDEFHVAPGAESATVRDLMTRFVDERLRPGDLAVVLKPLDPITSIQFTRDRDRLRSSIALFEGRKGDYTPRSTFEVQYIGHAPAAIAAARVQMVGAALRELSMRLGDMRADRAAIVLVSSGFPREAGGRQLRVPDLQGLIRAASRFHQALYTFDPTPGAVPQTGPEERPTSESATLQWLAAQTGGAAVRGDALASGLQRMANDLDSYYVLTYQPKQMDGRYHPIEVRARRRDVQVKARPGYWSPLASDWMAGLLTPTSAVPRRSVRRSTVIDAWAALARGADGRLRLVVTWTPKPPPTLRTPLTGLAQAQVPAALKKPQKVVVKARLSTGTDLFDGELASVGAGGGALAERAEFDAPVGRIELDMTVIAADGTTVDADVRDVEVPDAKAAVKGPILLPAAIVRARTAREFREWVVDPAAPPTPDRVFARGDRLLIRVSAIDAAGAVVPVQARIMNALAQPIRTLEAAQPPTSAGSQQFDLPLAWLAPGEYLLEMSAKSAAGQVTDRFTIRIR